MQAKRVKLADLEHNLFDEPFPPEVIARKPHKAHKVDLQRIAICQVAEVLSDDPDSRPLLRHVQPRITRAFLEIVGKQPDPEGPVPLNYTFTEMGEDLYARLPSQVAA